MEMAGKLAIVLALVLASGAVVACLVTRFGFRIARTGSGLAFVIPSYGLDGEPIRVLRVGGGNQSATYLDDDWAMPYGSYIKRFDLVFEAGVPVRDVLMLGGGGYSYPKHLLTSRADVALDVVEIDPAITRIAWRWFYLDRLAAYLSAEPGQRLGLITADGRSYLQRCEKRYDAILNDTFRGNKPARTLATLEAVRQCKQRLNPGGLYLANVIASFEGEDSQLLRDVVATLRQEFENVSVVPCWNSTARTVDNKLVIATDTDHAWPQAYRGNLERGGRVLRD